MKKKRRGGEDDPALLWKIEKQVDSAQQHLSKAISYLRVALHHTRIKQETLRDEEANGS